MRATIAEFLKEINKTVKYAVFKHYIEKLIIAEQNYIRLKENEEKLFELKLKMKQTKLPHSFHFSDEILSLTREIVALREEIKGIEKTNYFNHDPSVPCVRAASFNALVQKYCQYEKNISLEESHFLLNVFCFEESLNLLILQKKVNARMSMRSVDILYLRKMLMDSREMVENKEYTKPLFSLLLKLCNLDLARVDSAKSTSCMFERLSRPSRSSTLNVADENNSATTNSPSSSL